MKTPKLQIHFTVWKQLMQELKKRGGGERESGAFLLGYKQDKLVTSFICYDDLDPHAFDSGIIVFNGDGFIPLWKHCHANNLKVLADVHTHPDEWTGQSSSDRRHPMIAQAGHIALIIPNLALNSEESLCGVGIHEFLGDRHWKSWKEEDGIVTLN
jgi:hypothetical protein